jgi:hypothetical protein
MHPPPIRRGHADLGEVPLHQATAGEGPAVLLLHGWPQTWFLWRGGIAEGCGHRIPEERPDWTLAQLLGCFGEERG